MGTVTWKAMVYLLGALVLAQGGSLAWTDRKLDEKVSYKEYQSTADDIKWIKECMVKKCWDRP